MRRGLFLLGILVSCSLVAAAQGPAGVGAGPANWERVPRSDSPSFLSPWRLSLGYQYNRFNLTGTPFNTAGVNASASRMFTRWFGVEAETGFGYGKLNSSGFPPNLTVKSILAAGGPRLVHRGRGHLELWVHALGGIEHFQFNQTVGPLNNNTGMAGLLGGGADYRLTQNLTITGEVDAIETRFFGGYQRHFQAVTSLAFHY